MFAEVLAPRIHQLAWLLRRVTPPVVLRVVNVTASSFDETGRYAAQCSSGAVRICKV
jgi:hypothetical protein